MGAMGCGASKQPPPPQVTILSAREQAAPPYYDAAALSDLAEKCGNFKPNVQLHENGKPQSCDSMLEVLVRGSPAAVDSPTTLTAVDQRAEAQLHELKAMSCEGSAPVPQPQHVPSTSFGVRRTIDEWLQLASDEEVRARKQAASGVGAAASPPPSPPQEDTFAEGESSFRSSFNANSVSHFLGTEPERFGLLASSRLCARDHPILVRAFMADQAFLGLG